jgi:hypothetical protein
MSMVGPYALQGILRGTEITWLFEWRWPWRSLVKPWLAAAAAVPLALVVRLSGQGTPVEIAAAAVYLLAYGAAWMVIGIEPSDREVLAHLMGRPTADAHAQ